MEDVEGAIRLCKTDNPRERVRENISHYLLLSRSDKLTPYHGYFFSIVSMLPSRRVYASFLLLSLFYIENPIFCLYYAFVAAAKKSSNTKKLIADLVQSGLPESSATEAFAKELIAKVGGGKPKASQIAIFPVL